MLVSEEVVRTESREVEGNPRGKRKQKVGRDPKVEKNPKAERNPKAEKNPKAERRLNRNVGEFSIYKSPIRGMRRDTKGVSCP